MGVGASGTCKKGLSKHGSHQKARGALGRTLDRLGREPLRGTLRSLGRLWQGLGSVSAVKTSFPTPRESWVTGKGCKREEEERRENVLRFTASLKSLFTVYTGIILLAMLGAGVVVATMAS